MGMHLVDEWSRMLDEVGDYETREATKLRYFLGLDLGQPSEFSALAVLEMQGASAKTAEFHCRHLHRWPLRTPYGEIVADTIKTVGQLNAEAAPILAIDQTGVGPPVVKLFREGFDAPAREVRAAWVDLETGVAEPVGKWPRVDIEAIQITAGDEATREHRLTRVPKRDLVSAAQLALQSGRLKIAAGLAEAPTLQRELISFKTRIRLGAGDEIADWREGLHDDLVLAVCLALWTAQHGLRKQMAFA